MPYNLPKNLNTKGNNAKMERCVIKVMMNGKSKESAIAICKSSMMKKSKSKKSKNK